MPPCPEARRCPPTSHQSGRTSDADPLTSLADRTLQHISNTEFSSYLLRVNWLAFVSEARTADNDEKPANARERSDNFLDHAIREIFLLWIATHVGEGQNRDRRFVGKRKRGTFDRGRGRRILWCDPVCLDRLGNIFHLLRAEIGEPDR